MIKVPGFLGSGIHSGIKKKWKKDLALIYAEEPAKASAVFTKNIVRAAPLEVGMEHIKGGLCQAVLVNSGIANAYTGKRGLRDVKTTTKKLAKELNIDESLVFPSSTGLIGTPLPVDIITQAYPKLISELREGGFEDASEAIMTTDAFPKHSITKATIGGKKGTICCIGKGAGMISPNMATMLAYILTDINISKKALSKVLKNSVNNSFNRIIVDGDTSTNDTVLIMTSGKLGNKAVGDYGADFKKLEAAVTQVASDVAEMIIKDGEGATKAVKITVKGAKTTKDAEKVARTIGNSLLTKTAFYGEDPNWGRIVAAAGRAGVEFDPDKIDLFFDDHKVISSSKVVMDEKKAHKILKKPKFEVTLNLKNGKASSYVIASDLSFEYVKINAHYRT